MTKQYVKINFFDEAADLSDVYQGAIVYKYEPETYIESNLHIKHMNDGRYDLLIGRDEWIDEDLSKLESILFNWMAEEGFAS